MCGISKYFVIVAFMFFSLGSCTLMEKGFIDHNQQYVPKKPKYQLKDKPGGLPTNVDTLAVYRMVEMYNNGELVYPLPHAGNELNSIYSYIKFYGNGRCLIFTIPAEEGKGSPASLKLEDLNPDSPDYNKNYYYSPDGENIQVESFVYGDGQGYYVKLNYLVNDSGSSLVMQDEYIRMVYLKESIPDSWNERYEVNW